MSKRYHMSIDCTGALRCPKHFIGAIEVDGKRLITVQEVKEFFRHQIFLGRRVIPCGDCDNFDYETGCKGHDIEEE